MNPKYVTIEHNGFHSACILAPYERHCDVLPLPGKILGAGEFQISFSSPPSHIKVTCFGESVTLGVKSRGEQDAVILCRLLRIGKNF